MKYNFKNCTLEDEEFLFELKKQTLKYMLIKYGDGMIKIRKKD